MGETKEDTDADGNKKSTIMDFLDRHEVDIIAAAFFIGLFLYYSHYISLMQAPIWDGTAYLENARGWLTGSPLYESYRPPLISLLIAGIWAVFGESWVLIKWMQPLFTLGAGITLYFLLRREKGSLFAFWVTALTMLNTYVFFYGTQIMTEGMSLFFLVASIYLIRSENERRWPLAGIALGLAFASRYPVILQGLAFFFVECIVRKNRRLFTRVLAGAIPVIALVVLAVYMKTGAFETALSEDMAFSAIPSSFYLANSITIWGIAALFVPLAFLFKRTYIDKKNYSYIAWFIVAFFFWSANASNHDFRYAIQFAPATYYLAMLAVENIVRIDVANVTFGRIAVGARDFVARIAGRLRMSGLSKTAREANKVKVYFSLALLFWFALILASPLYFAPLMKIMDPDGRGHDIYDPAGGYYVYAAPDAGGNETSQGNRLIYTSKDSGSPSCKFEMPTEKMIILRMDDVQAYAWNSVSPNITDTILAKGMSITLGVIPKNLDKDPIMRNYLLGIRNNPRVEIAQHGTYHQSYEFAALDADETYNLTKEGQDKLVQVIGVRPRTFIPPNNEYNEGTNSAFSKLGFSVISARQDVYKFDGSIASIGYTAATATDDRKSLLSMGTVLVECKVSLNLRNVCVVMIHPQDYVNADRVTINSEKYNELLRLLDELKKLGAKSVTFKDLVTCR